MIRITAPSHPLSGTIHLSGSKSLSNRYLLLSAVLGKTITLENISQSKDTEVLVEALRLIDEATGKNHNQPITIHIGDAGTDMRFLTALLAQRHGNWYLTGSERMHERPIGPLVEALRQLGANIRYADREGFPPLLIEGKHLKGGSVQLPANISSQFISALLLIAPTLQDGLHIQLQGAIVSKPYIQMTVAVLKEAMVPCAINTNRLSLAPGSKPAWSTNRIAIESDWSSASYWYSFCALSDGTNIRLHHLYKTSAQGDAVLPSLYAPLGVKTTFFENYIELESTKTTATSFDFDFTDCPDLAQTLAVTCFAKGLDARLRGLSTLRIKETDRIQALETELAKLGAQVKSDESELFISPGVKPAKANKVLIKTYNDHRMAMSFAPLCLVMDALEIDRPEVVAKSYPSFWEDLKNMGFNVNLQP